MTVRLMCGMKLLIEQKLNIHQIDEYFPEISTLKIFYIKMESSKFSALPPEMMTEFLLKLSLEDLLNFCKTSQGAMVYCNNDKFWKAKYKHDFPNLPSTGNLTWKEQYKLIYTVPNSPISMGVSHYAIIDDQNMLYTGGSTSRHKHRVHYYHAIIKLPITSPLKRKVRSVSCGNFFTGAVTNDGRVYFWGRNLMGIFGISNYYISEPKEFKIPGKAIKIVCGPKIDRGPSATFVVILEDRTVFLRQTLFLKVSKSGSSSYDRKLVKIEVKDKINIKAIDISTNGYSLAIISTDGKLYYLGKGFGRKSSENTGMAYKNGKIEINPIHIPLPEPMKYVSLGYDHICVLSIKGNIYLWGSNKYGQLGQNWKMTPPIGHFFYHPQKLVFPVPISFINCGMGTTTVIDVNGKLYRWGRNLGAIHKSQHPDLENVIFNSKPTVAGRNTVISHPIQIEPTIEKEGNIVNYVEIGPNFSIFTTSDGIVNIWDEYNLIYITPL